MPDSRPPMPLTLGLFQKRIDGDDCLLELARRRFQQAGMGAEVHAETPEELEWIMKFLSAPDVPVVVHLPREFDLLTDHTRRRILEFAARFAGRVYGFVLHDRPDLVARQADFLHLAGELDSQMAEIKRCPLLFIEYAVGLDPAVFANLFAPLRKFARIGACLDTGHVGIWQARQTYSQIHLGEDICALRWNHADVPRFIADVERAVQAALPAVLDFIGAIGQLGLPVHFHLHDGHPLSTFSPYGVCDHLSFLTDIPIRFQHRDRRSLPLMFGPAGLSRIVTKALEAIRPRSVSFTLEIHPIQYRLPLGDAAPLFTHWRDKTNAEQMNHWLAVLTDNHRLLLEALRGSTPPHRPSDNKGMGTKE